MQHVFAVIFLFVFSQTTIAQSPKIITTDIDNFWIAYDKIVSTTDSVSQYEAIQKLYIDKGTPGLKGIMQVRDYSAKSFVDAINSYPKFWASVRSNTFRSKALGDSIVQELNKFKRLYPALKPADIYFTIGALRTSGTISDGQVLIGAELALADASVIASEFPEAMAKNLRIYFDSNPVNDVVLLNVHEYVHTQQHEPVNNLLSNSVYEGVAEFVSVKATGKPSAVPAIAFGVINAAKVRAQFEADMFSMYRTNQWLWSNDVNTFGVRDLGYYIGYALCEKYYSKALNKQQAIAEMINIDYSNEKAFGNFVDKSKFLSASLDELYKKFDRSRPQVKYIQQFKNGAQQVDPSTTAITINFSQKMDARFISTGLGDMGKEHYPGTSSVSFSADGMSVTYHVKLEAGKKYQILLENGYRNTNAIQLKPYLIFFTTALK